MLRNLFVVVTLAILPLAACTTTSSEEPTLVPVENLETYGQLDNDAESYPWINAQPSQSSFASEREDSYAQYEAPKKSERKRIAKSSAKKKK